MPTPTLAELARAGTLGAATAPLTNATAPVPPEITLAMLARAGLLGGNGFQPPGRPSPLTVAAGIPREELTNTGRRGLPSGDLPWYMPDDVGRMEEVARRDREARELPVSPTSLRPRAERPPGRELPPLMRGPTPGREAPTGREFREGALAAATSAIDPLGIPSGIAGLVDPTLRDDWRATQAANPGAALAGSVIAGGPGFGAARRTADTAAGLITRNPTLASLLSGGMLGTATVAANAPPPAGAQGTPPPDESPLLRSLREAGLYDGNIKGLQRRLTSEGLYSGPIDGTMTPGGPTEAAARALEARTRPERERRAAQELERTRLANQAAALKLEQEKATRTGQETDRANELAGQGAKELERLRNERSFMDQWGRPIGYATGGVVGALGRFGLGRLLMREGAETTRRANALSGRMGQGDVPERVGRLNQFWAEGAPTRPPPLRFESGRQPYPWRTDRNAPPANELFAPPTGWRGAPANYGPAVPGAIGGSVEWGLGQSWLSDARRDLAEAERALAAPRGTTPVNVQRYRDARDRVAQAEFMIAMGQGTLGGTFFGELEGRIARSRQRPDTSLAQGERGRLDQLLNPPPPVRGNPPPAAPPPAAPLPHHSTYQNRDGGSFARGRPNYPEGDPRRRP